MKITKSQLKQIIKEELSARLNEDYVTDWYASASPLAKEMVNVALGGDVDKARSFWQENFLKNSKDEEVIEAAKQVLNRIDSPQAKFFLPKAEGEPHRFGVAERAIVRLAKDASRYPDGAGCADGSKERPCPDPVTDAPRTQSPSAPQLENKMKLTKSQLKQIIKEEIGNILEWSPEGGYMDQAMKSDLQHNLEMSPQDEKTESCEQLLKDYKLAKQVYGDEYRRMGGGGMDILQQYEKIMNDAKAKLKKECPRAYRKLNALEEEGDLTELKTLLKAKVES